MLNPEQRNANRFAITYKDMESVIRYLEAYDELFNKQQNSSNSRYFDHCEAILVAAIVFYCRCFKKSQSADNAINKLHDTDFSFFSAQLELLDLHNQLLILRDKSIAHSDWEFHNTEHISTQCNTVLRRISIADYGSKIDIQMFRNLAEQIKRDCIAASYDIDRSINS